MLSFLLFGLFLLRLAQRTFLWLLLNAPPRKTRLLEPAPYSVKSMCYCFTVFIHPPNSLPISATIAATC